MNQSELEASRCNVRKWRESGRTRVDFAFHWLRIQSNVIFVDQSDRAQYNAKPKPTRINFDTQLKIALRYFIRIPVFE